MLRASLGETTGYGSIILVFADNELVKMGGMKINRCTLSVIGQFYFHAIGIKARESCRLQVLSLTPYGVFNIDRVFPVLSQ